MSTAVNFDAGELEEEWLAGKKATAVVIRPDGFIYAAAGSGRPLPGPPASFTNLAAATPTRTGAPA